MARSLACKLMGLRNVAIIQARMGSSRFPGKMLTPLGGTSLFEWVVRRLKVSRSLDQVVLATSDFARDDVLAEFGRSLGILVFRGSEVDVLDRFVGAAKMSCADNVVRICADNPFVDPGLVDNLVNYFKGNPCDYACNHQDRIGSNYADGFGAEILSTTLLEKIAAIAFEPFHREHVTQYLWDNASDYNLIAIPAPNELAFPDLHFDVDTQADLVKLEELVRLGVTTETSASEIIKIARSNRHLTSLNFQGRVHDSIELYLQRLFPLCRSITGEPNRQTLKILQEIIPLTIHEVPSGTVVYDWTIPAEWSITGAWIADSAGRRLIDFQDNNLHVVSYSEPMNCTLNWFDLQPHLHRHPELVDAIPYRTSYYKRDWGFCLTNAQYDEMKKLEDTFTVVIESELKPGSLTYGEYLLPGRSEQEILISCYICHPSMANDSLSGVLLTAFLASHIASIENRHWSYRIVFVPETIGAVAYCAQNEMLMKRIDIGLVITTVGGPGKFGYKCSFDESHPINSMIEEVFRDAKIDFTKYPFDVHGSDERQYSSQGFRINSATICRDRYYEYPFYHSSLDNLHFVTPGQILETLKLYISLIEKIEARRIYKNTIPHGEVMLSRHNLYPVTGGAQIPELGGRSELDLILWLLFLCDGKLDIRTIAKKLKVPLTELTLLADRLVTNGVLEII